MLQEYNSIFIANIKSWNFLNRNLKEGLHFKVSDNFLIEKRRNNYGNYIALIMSASFMKRTIL